MEAAWAFRMLHRVCFEYLDVFLDVVGLSLGLRSARLYGTEIAATVLRAYGLKIPPFPLSGLAAAFACCESTLLEAIEGCHVLSGFPSIVRCFPLIFVACPLIET